MKAHCLCLDYFLLFSYVEKTNVSAQNKNGTQTDFMQFQYIEP